MDSNNLQQLTIQTARPRLPQLIILSASQICCRLQRTRDLAYWSTTTGCEKKSGSYICRLNCFIVYSKCLSCKDIASFPAEHAGWACLDQLIPGTHKYRLLDGLPVGQTDPETGIWLAIVLASNWSGSKFRYAFFMAPVSVECKGVIVKGNGKLRPSSARQHEWLALALHQFLKVVYQFMDAVGSRAWQLALHLLTVARNLAIQEGAISKKEGKNNKYSKNNHNMYTHTLQLSCQCHIFTSGQHVLRKATSLIPKHINLNPFQL